MPVIVAVVTIGWSLRSSHWCTLNPAVVFGQNEMRCGKNARVARTYIIRQAGPFAGPSVPRG